MGKFKKLIRVAAVVGPTVVKLVQTYGPQIRQLINSNPEYFNVFKQRLGVLASSNSRALKHLADRVDVLREQAAYLYGAANKADTAQQAAQWRDELENIAKAIPVLHQLDRSKRKKTRKNLEQHVDDLAYKIVQTTLEDDIEDAEIVTDTERDE